MKYEVQNQQLSQTTAEVEERQSLETEHALSLGDKEDDAPLLDMSWISSLLYTSINHSGVTHIKKQIMDVGVQNDSIVVDQPNIQENNKICTDKIKAAWATVSINCRISVENARM